MKNGLKSKKESKKMSNKTDLIQNNEALQNLLTRIEELPSKQDFEDLQAEFQAELDKANESWVGTLTFTSTSSTKYNTSDYFTEAGCSLAVDKQKGMAFVTIQGGTSTSYENIYFTDHTLPTGVSALTTQTYGGPTSGTAQRYFTQVLTGITGKINVTVDLNAVNSFYDYVQTQLTVTYA